MNKEFVPIEISYNLPPQQLFFNVLKNDKLVSVGRSSTPLAQAKFSIYLNDLFNMYVQIGTIDNIDTSN